MLSLFLFLTFLTPSYSFYIPLIAPVEYQKGQVIQIKVKAIARISVTLLLFKSIKYIFKVVSTLQSFQTVKKQIIHILM